MPRARALSRPSPWSRRCERVGARPVTARSAAASPAVFENIGRSPLIGLAELHGGVGGGYNARGAEAYRVAGVRGIVEAGVEAEGVCFGAFATVGPGTGHCALQKREFMGTFV